MTTVISGQCFAGEKGWGESVEEGEHRAIWARESWNVTQEVLTATRW